jgi:hypothetical protein
MHTFSNTKIILLPNHSAFGESLFFAYPKKSNQKKRHPAFGFCFAKIPSLRHDFGGRREGPSMALHSSIGHPAQLPPKIAPPLGQKKGFASAPRPGLLSNLIADKLEGSLEKLLKVLPSSANDNDLIRRQPYLTIA